MLDKLKAEKVVAVVRADSKDEAMQYVEAIIKGGMNAIELTYSIPEVCELISEVVSKYPEALVGVGSVLNVKQAQNAVAAGATYVVSPGYVKLVQEYCTSQEIIYMPGAMTISEIINSIEHGNEIVKVFPGGTLGTGFISAVKAPIPNAQLMVTGGVDLDNVEEWFKAGVTLVGTGSSLTAPGKTGDFAKITAMAKAFKEKTRCL